MKLNFPFIPGGMTASEIELALESGYNILKLFPVAQLGGVDFLKALMGPYGHTRVMFIPMGNKSSKFDFLVVLKKCPVGWWFMAGY